ncbi:MAG: PQQ-binding-like beta-propeller repeat protein [Alphaproteobacteria bacterium]|nr:PQQ-binding-like beta-propeller repeat protein [Alphaproteobacteria bacterium]MDE2353079.1 PQQ-binding-like beta-propeller repeat protein [Alphaproteobacteria bacterium]
MSRMRYGVARSLFVLSGIAGSLTVMAMPALAGPPATPQAAYRTVMVVPLGAPDRWDYLHYDAASGRVYVSHGSEVTVVDGQTGKIIGSITGMPGGTHGIAISHATGQGFTDDGRAGEAVAFNLKTLKVTKRIKAEPDADGIVYDPSSRHVFVIDGDSGALTVVDPRTDEVVATVHVGAPLEFGVSGHNGKLYVNGVRDHDIVRIDTRTNTVDAHWAMPGCEHPRGLAIDRQHHRLFSTCANGRMVVLNAASGAVVARLPIDKGSDAARFDPRLHFALSSNFSGTLSVIREDSPDKYTVLSTVKTEMSARTLGLDAKTGRIFLLAADIKVNPAASPKDYRHRYQVTPNSLKLYMLDPTR